MAIHEAGHAVAAWAVGTKPTSIVTRVVLRRTEDEPWSVTDDPACCWHRLEGWVAPPQNENGPVIAPVIAMAGPYAEARHRRVKLDALLHTLHGNVDQPLHSDLGQLELWHVLEGNDWNEYIGRTLELTRSVLIPMWPAVLVLAELVIERGELDGDEIERAVRPSVSERHTARVQL